MTRSSLLQPDPFVFIINSGFNRSYSFYLIPPISRIFPDRRHVLDNFVFCYERSCRDSVLLIWWEGSYTGCKLYLLCTFCCHPHSLPRYDFIQSLYCSKIFSFSRNSRILYFVEFKPFGVFTEPLGGNNRRGVDGSSWESPDHLPQTLLVRYRSESSVRVS